jgi:hypothetical protein
MSGPRKRRDQDRRMSGPRRRSSQVRGLLAPGRPAALAPAPFLSAELARLHPLRARDPPVRTGLGGRAPPM